MNRTLCVRALLENATMRRMMIILSSFVGLVIALKPPPQSMTTTKPIKSTTASKSIVLVRHGRTHMNELINGINYGTPGFTDIFPNEQQMFYHDSPLHPIGIRQAQALSERVANQQDLGFSVQDLDLVVISPLTRALETYEIGLHSHVPECVPKIAHPAAAERLYMVSDVGKTRRELRRLYGHLNIDFDSAFPDDHAIDDDWHWVPTRDEAENYQEWRPHGEGQVYACLGELESRFDARMSRLYRWLQSRPESTIMLVCHYAVIEWMMNGDKFQNCEARAVPFERFCPRNLVVEDVIERTPLDPKR